MTYPQFLVHLYQNYRYGTVALRDFIELEEHLLRVQYSYSRTALWDCMVDRGRDLVQTHSHASFELFWKAAIAVFPWLENEVRYCDFLQQK